MKLNIETKEKIQAEYDAWQAEQYAKEFASIINDKNASDDLKKCIIADEKTRMLVIEGIIEKYK